MVSPRSASKLVSMESHPLSLSSLPLPSIDPNFPAAVRAKIEYFLSGDASTLENYDLLLEEMKIGESDF